MARSSVSTGRAHPSAKEPPENDRSLKNFMGMKPPRHGRSRLPYKRNTLISKRESFIPQYAVETSADRSLTMHERWSEGSKKNRTLSWG